MNDNGKELLNTFAQEEAITENFEEPQIEEAEIDWFYRKFMQSVSNSLAGFELEAV